MESTAVLRRKTGVQMGSTGKEMVLMGPVISLTAPLLLLHPPAKIEHRHRAVAIGSENFPGGGGGEGNVIKNPGQFQGFEQPAGGHLPQL